MAIPFFLAMTAAEFTNSSAFPPHIAWMACHFSPYGTGLTNLPKQLPEGSLLILNDRTPICGHDPALVCQALWDTAEKHRCSGILLDLQRPDCREASAIIEKALTLPLPVAVSDLYAQRYDCPVFLSPLPPHRALADHIAPWQGREVWLEAALGGCCITVTEQGSTFMPLPAEGGEFPLQENMLHCHYRIETTDSCIRFSLQRTKQDLEALLEEAEALGITRAVGLYQELG